MRIVLHMRTWALFPLRAIHTLSGYLPLSPIKPRISPSVTHGMNGPDDERDVIEFESAEDQLAEQRATERLGRKILTKTVVGAVCILVLGIVIGGAGVHHFSSRVPPLSVAEYTAYGEVLAHMPDPAAPPCADFQTYAGSTSVEPPAFELHGVARRFVETALALPRSHVGLREFATVDHTLRVGLSVRGVWVRRAERTDALLAHDEAVWPIEVGVDGGHSHGTTALALCSGACRNDTAFLDMSNADGCELHLMDVVRAMVGCSCCEDDGNANCSAPVVVQDFAAVCAKLPLSNADALVAARANDLAVQTEVGAFTTADLSRVAAEMWPSMVTFQRASASAEAAVRRVVASVLEAAHTIDATFAGEATAVSVGWPEMPNSHVHHLSAADMPGHLPEHVSLGDLILALRHQRAAAWFDAPAVLRAERPFSATVTFERGAVHVPPSLAQLTPALPAYRDGAVAHAVARAVAPAVACAGSSVADTAAMLLAETAGQLDPAAVDGPVLYAVDELEIGPAQLFYIGAAAVSGQADCRIGYVPDNQYALAMECPPAPCVGCGCH